MGFEELKPLTPKEEEQMKSRMISDAALKKGGADERADGSLNPTWSQVREAKNMMQEELPYSEKAVLDGPEGEVKFEVKYDEGSKEYRMEFSDIDDPSRKVLMLGNDRKVAKEVFYSVHQNVIKLSLDVGAARDYAENALKNLKAGWGRQD